MFVKHDDFLELFNNAEVDLLRLQRSSAKLDKVQIVRSLQEHPENRHLNGLNLVVLIRGNEVKRV